MLHQRYCIYIHTLSSIEHTKITTIAVIKMYGYITQARLAELYSSQPLFERMFRKGKVSSSAFFVHLNVLSRQKKEGVMNGINRTVLTRIKSVFFISFKTHSLYSKEPFPAFRDKRGSFYFEKKLSS
jgi:hypothetical protein